MIPDPVSNAAARTLLERFSGSTINVVDVYDPVKKVLLIIATGEEAEASKKVLEHLQGKK